MAVGGIGDCVGDTAVLVTANVGCTVGVERVMGVFVASGPDVADGAGGLVAVAGSETGALVGTLLISRVGETVGGGRDGAGLVVGAAGGGVAVGASVAAAVAASVAVAVAVGGRGVSDGAIGAVAIVVMVGGAVAVDVDDGGTGDNGGNS